MLSNLGDRGRHRPCAGDRRREEGVDGARRGAYFAPAVAGL